jgi:hypothetical protein
MGRNIYERFGLFLNALILTAALDGSIGPAVNLIDPNSNGLPNGRSSQQTPETNRGFYHWLVTKTQTDKASGEIISPKASLSYFPELRLILINRDNLGVTPVLLAANEDPKLFTQAIGLCRGEANPAYIRIEWLKVDGHMTISSVDCGNEDEIYRVWISQRTTQPQKTPKYDIYNQPIPEV